MSCSCGVPEFQLRLIPLNYTHIFAAEILGINTRRPIVVWSRVRQVVSDSRELCGVFEVKFRVEEEYFGAFTSKSDSVVNLSY